MTWSLAALMGTRRPISGRRHGFVTKAAEHLIRKGMIGTEREGTIWGGKKSRQSTSKNKGEKADDRFNICQYRKEQINKGRDKKEPIFSHALAILPKKNRSIRRQ